MISRPVTGFNIANPFHICSTCTTVCVVWQWSFSFTIQYILYEQPKQDFDNITLGCKKLAFWLRRAQNIPLVGTVTCAFPMTANSQSPLNNLTVWSVSNELSIVPKQVQHCDSCLLNGLFKRDDFNSQSQKMFFNAF